KADLAQVPPGGGMVRVGFRHRQETVFRFTEISTLERVQRLEETSARVFAERGALTGAAQEVGGGFVVRFQVQDTLPPVDRCGPVTAFLGRPAGPAERFRPAGRSAGRRPELRVGFGGSVRFVKRLAFSEPGDRFLAPVVELFGVRQEPAAALVIRVKVDGDLPPADSLTVIAE